MFEHFVNRTLQGNFRQLVMLLGAEVPFETDFYIDLLFELGNFFAMLAIFLKCPLIIHCQFHFIQLKFMIAGIGIDDNGSTGPQTASSIP